ncbi:hypothetical protein AAG747_14115 [Rapidithrix thailandica]|uniref:Uncharacterized protein n=1 Tax=Rapidithrix thailandica TaxID=413964 RepID=A0AAW9S1K3_9BACT
MNKILSLKQVVDNFNFFLMTTAGYSLLILIMVLPEAVGTVLFFTQMLSGRLSDTGHAIPFEYQVAIGCGFATLMQGGIYFLSITGHHRASSWLAGVSALLAIVSFGRFLLSGLDFSTLELTILFWMKVIGVLIISIAPAVMIGFISARLADKIDTELAQQKDLHREVDKITIAGQIEAVRKYFEGFQQKHEGSILQGSLEAKVKQIERDFMRK